MEILLGNLKSNKEKYIDTIAENVRMQFITPGFGQMMVYKEKYEQATDFVLNDYPSEVEQYPHILAEVKATNRSPKEIAHKILQKQSLWISKSAQIEEIRLKSKIDIENAQSKEEIDQLVMQAVRNLKSL